MLRLGMLPQHFESNLRRGKSMSGLSVLRVGGNMRHGTHQQLVLLYNLDVTNKERKHGPDDIGSAERTDIHEAGDAVDELRRHNRRDNACKQIQVQIRANSACQ